MWIIFFELFCHLFSYQFKNKILIYFIYNHSCHTMYDSKKSTQSIMLTFKVVAVTTFRWHLVKRCFLAFLVWIFCRIIGLAPRVTFKCWWTQTSLYFHFLLEDMKGMCVKSYRWETDVVFRGFRRQQWERVGVPTSDVFQYASGKFMITKKEPQTRIWCLAYFSPPLN